VVLSAPLLTLLSTYSPTKRTKAGYVRLVQ